LIEDIVNSIKIGKYYFHDWEDDVEREKLYFTSKINTNDNKSTIP